jgi:hypothetical protein
MSTSGMNGLPGAGAMEDTLEFVRNMWGSMKIPGMAMPSLSPDEINKQITDLKAVESWLQLNMNMLRSSIQALEVQSATLTALHSMGKSFSQAVNPQDTATDKPAFESPFAAFTAADDTQSGDQSAGSGALPDPAAMASQFANPAAWWNVVQDQFNQAVSKAIVPAPKAKKTAHKTATGPAARKKAAPSRAASAKPRARKKSAT